jgi:hypothetical protein
VLDASIGVAMRHGTAKGDPLFTRRTAQGDSSVAQRRRARRIRRPRPQMEPHTTQLIDQFDTETPLRVWAAGIDGHLCNTACSFVLRCHCRPPCRNPRVALAYLILMCPCITTMNVVNCVYMPRSAVRGSAMTLLLLSTSMTGVEPGLWLQRPVRPLRYQ